MPTETSQVTLTLHSLFLYLNTLGSANSSWPLHATLYTLLVDLLL